MLGEQTLKKKANERGKFTLWETDGVEGWVQWRLGCFSQPPNTSHAVEEDLGEVPLKS